MKVRKGYRTIQVLTNTYQYLEYFRKKSKNSHAEIVSRMILYFNNLPKKINITAHLRLDECGNPYYDIMEKVK